MGCLCVFPRLVWIEWDQAILLPHLLSSLNYRYHANTQSTVCLYHSVKYKVENEKEN